MRKQFGKFTSAPAKLASDFSVWTANFQNEYLRWCRFEVISSSLDDFP